MNKGVVIHLDDRKEILETGANLYKQMNIELDLILCETEEQFKQALNVHDKNVKSLIFDLHNEDASGGKLADPEFLTIIEESFAAYNVPIFIYSAFLEKLEGKYDDCGTIFKVAKDESIEVIFSKIELFHASGFIEVFCRDGILETELFKDLHKAFTKQFTNDNQIINTINLIKNSVDQNDFKHRVQRSFKRIAVRSLLTELLSPEVDENGEAKEELVGITEHYVQRLNKISIWTGDIFKNSADEFIFIMMPRCNAIRCDEYLVCPFYLGKFPDGMKSAKMAGLLTGDPLVSGYQRHLPPSPIFDGGEIALSKFFMKSRNEILESFSRVISLSEELTNEVLGKFASYFFRTGITPWNRIEGLNEYKHKQGIK